MEEETKKIILNNITAGSQVLPIIEIKKVISNEPIKKYTGLTIALGIFTFFHLLFDALFYWPFGKIGLFMNIPFGILIPLALFGLLISAVSYVLSIIASTKIGKLIKNKEPTGALLLVWVLVNFGLLIITLIHPNSIVNFHIDA